MAKNNKKAVTDNGRTAVKQENKANGGKSNQRGARLFITIFAAVAAVAIIVSSVIGIVGYVEGRAVLDYINDDLSQYISFSREDYLGIDVPLRLDEVSDLMVENEIIKLQYKNRSEKPEVNGNVKNETVRVGDDANIYYFGYTLDENGQKIGFDGGCNFSEKTSTSLGIGSGGMICGFELALIGKNMQDYATLSKVSSDTVSEGDWVYFSYNAIYYDGATTNEPQTALVNLSSPTLDEEWGEGFKDYLIGAKVGEKIIEYHYRDKINEYGNTETDMFYGITVNQVITIDESKPVLTIDATFPLNYSRSEALRGKDVKFDVYIMTTKKYTTPAFDDAFITDTLKVTAEELMQYGSEGDSLTDRYRAKIRAELIEDYNTAKKSLAEQQFWTVVEQCVRVKKYPKAELNNIYNTYVEQVTNYYNSAQGQFSSLDDAAITYLGLNKGDDWEAFLMEEAKLTLVQKLSFYYIAREEGLLTDESERQEQIAKLRQECVDGYLEQYGVVRDKYKTEEEYLSAVETYEKMVDATYDEEYFRDNVYFLYVIELVAENANYVPVK